MFSVITMASSTTSPTESTTASIDSTLIEPISDTGITMQGISVTRQLRRKRKMMMMTRMKAS